MKTILYFQLCSYKLGQAISCFMQQCHHAQRQLHDNRYYRTPLALPTSLIGVGVPAVSQTTSLLDLAHTCGWSGGTSGAKAWGQGNGGCCKYILTLTGMSRSVTFSLNVQVCLAYQKKSGMKTRSFGKYPYVSPSSSSFWKKKACIMLY